MSGTRAFSSFERASWGVLDDSIIEATASCELPSESLAILIEESPSTLVADGLAEPVVRERPVRHAGRGNFTISVDLKE